MANVDSFLLQKPKDNLEFRKYVLNIIESRIWMMAKPTDFSMWTYLTTTTDSCPR